MYKKVIGLEIHAQIATKTKLFSRALIDEGAAPNSCVNYLDAGYIGTLPVVNKEAVYMALKTCLALDMDINEVSVFDRKHYFYQDLPLGYQITQLYKPIGIKGSLATKFGKYRINRLHIEADAGKSVYSNESTLIDLNRCGVPLMEIVTEPDFSSAIEVVEFLKELRGLLITIGTCKCNMELGNMRADVNISLHKENEPLGTRVEIKNLNSFKFISQAIEYEAKEQENALNKGITIAQSTKLFDTKKQATFIMREKENSVDYRYFPDPDLLPIKLERSLIEEYRNNLPKLPQKIRAEYMELGVLKEHAYTLTQHPMLTAFFEKVLKTSKNALITANWITCELFGKLAKANIDTEEFISSRPDFAEEFGKIIVMCENKEITRATAKSTLDQLIQSPIKISDMKFTKSITNDQLIEISNNILKEHPDEVERYKNGKTQLLMFFVGQIMKSTSGLSEPEEIEKILLDLLK